MVTPALARAGGALERDATAFYQAVSHLVRVYQFRDRQRICYRGISVTQCYALSALVEGGAMRLDALAGELFLDKSTASRVVDCLEQEGYVRRGEDRLDGRAVRLEATRKGRTLHAAIVRDLIEEQKRLIEEFPADVRRAAAALISKLARSAEAKFGSTRGCAPRERSTRGRTD
jgi:DNA-binding MarR family transcriptional regulator